MRVVRYETLEQVQSLRPLLEAYIRFVVADLDRYAGVSFSADELIENTMSDLSKVLPPKGWTFAAENDDGEAIGMVFLRKSTDAAMEIKRLFVTPSARGTGAGHALLESSIEQSKKAGSNYLRLDTSANLETAIALYERRGFRHRPPYEESDHFNDPVLAPHLVFMELDLSEESR
ncbi:MAG: GNAT family N-acetyltransferase [Boseongicola sp.]|nr:GNAT family N-acetyltransferase [Boseongicola sp.]MDD9978584.1 GNAT family N-acetyltransferase [Boseongicola sp.]